ncbi:hypothetical protein [Methanobrevibacter sp.]|uniref:hypothetical protein n=1 Tax=Methanobrevibacter sp. TaxID=66852 RepID=UPI00388F3CD3
MKDNNIKSKKDDDSKKSNNEIIEVKSMEEFIELVNRPIVIESNTLGTLELRPIFDDDLNYLLKNIKDGLDGESLCKGFIINQLISPEISIESLNDLNQSEIKSILERYLKCNNMDEFFNLSNDDVYNDFKEGVIAYREHIVKPFEDNYDKMVDSIRNSLSSLNIYSGLEDYILNTQITSMQQMANNLGVSQAVQNLKHMADITSPIDDALKYSAVSQAVSAVDSARRMVGSVVESNMAAVSQALTGVDAMSQTMINLNHVFNNSAIFQASEILKAIQPQIDFWNDWINSNEYIIKFFEDYNEFWKNVQERYNISKKRALNCIKKYHWFISPSMDPSIVYDLVSICESNSKSKWGAINHVFNDYFLGNDCENLDLFVDNWSSNPIFDGRMKIIRDCVKIIKNCPKDVNFSNLVVPVLIAQIDGIQMEFMSQKGLKVDRNIVCDLDGNRKKDEHGQNIKFDRYIRDLTSGDEYLDAMSDVFLDVLFQHTMQGEGYQTSIKFSRHKIMHGENFHYGRIYNAMRCFMILDFLHGLSLEN